jgi:hypothetical protein
MARGHFGAGKAGLTPGLRSMRAVSTPADSRLTPQHTVAVQQLHGVLQGAQHRGLALPPLLLRAGIPPSLLEAPQARVSQRQYASLLRVLRRVLRDELWGLTSRPLPPGSFALCAQRLVHARTLEQALRLGFGFYHLLLADFTPRLERDGTLARVRIMRRAPFNPRLDYAQKAFMLFASAWPRGWWLGACRWCGVDYTQPAPPAAKAHACLPGADPPGPAPRRPVLRRALAGAAGGAEPAEPARIPGRLAGQPADHVPRRRQRVRANVCAACCAAGWTRRDACRWKRWPRRPCSPWHRRPCAGGCVTKAALPGS